MFAVIYKFKIKEGFEEKFQNSWEKMTYELKGNMREYWSITIEKPWCIIFKYNNGEFSDVEIGDYHD